MSTARKLILYVIYFVVVVALGAAIIFAFTGSSPAKKPVAKAPHAVHYTNNPAADTQSAPASATAGTSGESVKAAIAAANPPAQLTNTGPGSTAAIFIVSTVAGSLLYRRRQLSRLG
jgi:flagellar basal body-associated protein FliL